MVRTAFGQRIRFFDYPSEADKTRAFRIQTIEANPETLYADRDQLTYLMFHTDNTLAWHKYLSDEDIHFSIHSNGTIVIQHKKLGSKDPVSKLPEPLLLFITYFTVRRFSRWWAWKSWRTQIQYAFYVAPNWIELMTGWYRGDRVNGGEDRNIFNQVTGWMEGKTGTYLTKWQGEWRGRQEHI